MRQKRLSQVSLAALLTASGVPAIPVAAGGDDFDIYFGEYFRRSDNITSGAGDAKEVNAAGQIINPFPPHVFDRHIPGDGQRLSGAVERYQDVTKLKNAAPTITPDLSAGSTGSSGSTGSH